MRAVVQRVSQASVAVGEQVVGAIGEPGLLVLVGASHEDTPQTAAKLAAKLWGLRILKGELSCSDTAAPLLVISQFTLYADTRKGRRPSWQGADPARSPGRSSTRWFPVCGRWVPGSRPASSVPTCRSA